MHSSLNQAQVETIIRIVAGASGLSFNDARDMLAMRWAEFARERIRANLQSYEMWEDMVNMANRAAP